MSAPKHDATPTAQWDEQTTQTFIDISRYVVPEREVQIETICDLIPPLAQPFNVIELCCGEGLLAEAILARYTECTVYGYDGSTGMLETARRRLSRFGDRFQPVLFDLADTSWRAPMRPVHAVVSSLAVHHLDGEEKFNLFEDMHGILSAGGVLVIADVVQCAHPLGNTVAAKAWDQAVQRRAQMFDGNSSAFEFFDREKWNMYRYFDPTDIDRPSPLFDQLKWLEQAGFIDVDVYWMQAGHALFGGRKAA